MAEVEPRTRPVTTDAAGRPVNDPAVRDPKVHDTRDSGGGAGKWIAIAIAALAVLALLYWLFSGDEAVVETDTPAAIEQTDTDAVVVPAEDAEATDTDVTAVPVEDTTEGVEDATVVDRKSVV